MFGSTRGRRMPLAALVAGALLMGCGGQSLAPTPTALPTAPAATAAPEPTAATATATQAAATQSTAATNAPATPKPTAAGPSCAPVPKGIVAWWTADDTATDAIGTADGVLQGGAGYTTGMVGRSFSFTGAAPEVTVANAAALQLRHGLTIEGWVLAIKAPAAYAGLAGTWDDATGPNRTYLFWVVNGTLELVLSTDGYDYPKVTAPKMLPIGQWTHVAATYNGSTMRLYVNGASVAQAPMTGDLATNQQPFAIGRTSGGGVGANYWAGLIDELAVYNRALTAKEIKGIYAAGDAGKCPA
ncbi:MAG TPA: LamG domain-containing protein [Candidatus Limnocylindrales bacterium]|nr:LamG domain-containing protein [Candidatus Limnocylindrales bacterium]